MPSFVIGANELANTREKIVSGSNSIALQPVLGVNNPDPQAGFTCHLDDVAYVHIGALDSNIPGNQGDVVSYSGANGIQFNDAKKIAESISLRKSRRVCSLTTGRSRLSQYPSTQARRRRPLASNLSRSRKP